jgi:hypothetical protein
MSKISLTPNASGTGNFTIASPNSNTDRTLTLPDNTGTIITTASTFGGTGPAFRAYRNGNQTISAATGTKIAFNAEDFDTNSNYDSTTNYRFTPTVAGYYQINANAGFTTGSGQLNIYKNGSNYQTGVEVTYNASMGGHFSINDLVYLNGSTDYIEIYTYLTTGTTITSGSTNTAFSASLVRSA